MGVAVHFGDMYDTGAGVALDELGMLREWAASNGKLFPPNEVNVHKAVRANIRCRSDTVACFNRFSPFVMDECGTASLYFESLAVYFHCQGKSLARIGVNFSCS